VTVKYRNYFSGFSFLTGTQYGHFRSKEGERARPLHLAFSGNDSAYDRTIPIVYGRARVADPILLIAKPEGDFLTTLWAVCEGVLAANPADNTQSGSGYNPNYAYSAVLDASGNRVEKIFVNGESRHDPRPGFGIEVSNGDQDRGEPIAAFFPTDPTDFITNHLGYWGTARVTFRINTKSNPSVDLTGGQVSGSFEIQFGRIHRVYSDATTFVLRATDDGVNVGANPSFVQMDLLASKRAGAGLDYSRLNIQSFVDFAAYCSQTVTNVFDGTDVKRWTFNGVIDQSKSLADWLHDIAIGCYSLPPYPDKDGLLKIRALKAEDTSSVPLFSSKVASTRGRNIIWENNHSSLVKSRRPITEVPNEVRVSFVDKSYDPQYVATLISNINATSDPVSFTVQWSAAAIAAGVQFAKDDKIIIDSETLWITLAPSLPDGSHHQTLHCQRAYNATTKAAHANPARVQFTGRAYAKIAVVVADRDVQDEFGQVLGDQSRQAITKSYTLPGTTTEDEAARIGTLILRAGEFGQGGLDNNLTVIFKIGYRDAEDLEIGDIIEVEDDLLSPTDDELFFRIIKISPMSVSQSEVGIAFTREVTCVLHDNNIYDDTAFSVFDFTRINGSGANDVAPPPVTDFGVAENGIFDANNKPVTTLAFDYTEPSPLGNFRSVIIYRSTDDGAGLLSSPPTAGNPVGDWRYIVEVLESGQTLQYPISGEYEWFCAVSRPVFGHTPDIDTQLADGSFKYPRAAVLVDGVTDLLPAPLSPSIQALSYGIQLKWLPYTGSNLPLYKTFHIYRNTVNDFSTASFLASDDGTLFVDSTVDASTTYYYWIVGFSVLNQEGSPTIALSTTTSAVSGTDSAVPDAPTIAVINDEIAGFHANIYNWLVLISKPISAANWNSISATILQIATDSGFTAFPTGASLDGATTGAGGLYSGAPPIDVPFSTAFPGTYYMRAKLRNSFGDSAWSSPTIHRSTDYEDSLALDADIPDAPDGLAVTKNLTLGSLGGALTKNAFNVTFRIPKTNTQSYYGYSIYIHNSSTLPVATTQYSSFAHACVTGSLSVGSNVLTVAGVPGFTVNAFAGKSIVVFSAYRGAVPSFDYEGQLFVFDILSNTIDTITFNIATGLEIYALSGLGFYVVNSNSGDHFWEKLTLTTPLELDQADLSVAQDLSTTRTALFNSDIANVYVWVALYNLHGQGRVTASPPTLAFTGTLGFSVARLKISGSSARNPSFYNPAVESTTMPKRHIPSGIAAGATVLGLADTPALDTEKVFVGALYYIKDTDYTISGSIITLMSPLSDGDKVEVWY
jgi:hypothetical protein